MFEPGGDMVVELGSRGGKSKKKNSKRRFSEEQVRSLESMFENETKLEPRQKAEVASQLGLHPRQVAIWFQNKRARWKSKQLQHDFDLLRRSYDALAASFDLLRKDNQSLSIQVQKLKELLGNTQENTKVGVCDGDVGGNRSSVITTETAVNDPQQEDNNKKKKKKNKKNADDENDTRTGLGEEGGNPDCLNTNYLAMEEEAADFLAMVEPSCSSLTSDEEWHGLHSDSLFDQSPSSCEWWDFWT